MVTVEAVRLVRLRRRSEGFADGLGVGCSRALARLWPEPESKVVLFPNGEDEALSKFGRGVWESGKGENHIFYFRYDISKQ